METQITEKRQNHPEPDMHMGMRDTVELLD
jgi:hypothetical protein